MKSRIQRLTIVTTTALLFTGSVFAQNAAPMATTGGNGATSASYQTSQGELVVRSVAAPAPVVGPAPSFEQLSGGGKSIDEAQAAAYPPLANDFLHADSNRNGKINKAEYMRWLKQL